MMADCLYFSRPKYNTSGERVMKLADVVAAREQAVPRPSWGAIMIKAFALAAKQHPEMRQCYFEFPWGHIGEFAAQKACVVVGRRMGDEDVIFLAPLESPENQSLQALDAALRGFQHEPIESFLAFRQAMMLGRMPRLVARLVLWLFLQVVPSRRIRHFGTFVVTTTSPFGLRANMLPAIGGPVLTYGAISETGEVAVGAVVDHRVMDGPVVGFTLMEMEQILHRQIRAELLAMKGSALAA
jgi:hypothetical protein